MITMQVLRTLYMWLVLGDIEKLRCRYDMRKISRYNDIHDISCLVLFRNNIFLHASPFLIYIVYL